MICKWRGKLRAWLIDLVRDAIRMERIVVSRSEHISQPAPRIRAVPATPPRPVIVQVEPSFEQMQAEAIAQQEKFYEPITASIPVIRY